MNLHLWSSLILLFFVRADEFSDIIPSLPSYQNADGGFGVTPPCPSSLEGTVSALFLSSLYGIQDQIDTQQAAYYVLSGINGDFGYSKGSGTSSNIESVRNALFSLQHLGVTIPHAKSTAAYVRSLHNRQTKLFSPRPGQPPDLKSTVAAFASLELLGELRSVLIQEGMPVLKKWLHDHIVPGKHHFKFPEESNLQMTSANYYGILLASYVGLPLPNPKKWESFVSSLQQTDPNAAGYGGVFTSTARNKVTIESTAHAVASLNVLQEDGSSLKIDTAALLSYLRTIPRNLKAAARAHTSISYTDAFAQFFNTVELFPGVPNDEFVMQGTSLTAALNVTTFGATPHSGLDVNVEVLLPGRSLSLPFKLAWSPSEKIYVAASSFDTVGILGEATLQFSVRCFVAGVGEITFDVTDSFQLGYSISVDATAMKNGLFLPQDSVGAGTDFTFLVSLSNTTHNSIGASEPILMTILDSSDTVVVQQELEYVNSTEFTYKLPDCGLPAGLLTFTLELGGRAPPSAPSARVGGDGLPSTDLVGVDRRSGNPHTRWLIQYGLDWSMVATAVAFDPPGATLRLGSRFSVSMVPASLDRTGALTAYNTTTTFGAPTHNRIFYLDVVTPHGVVVDTFPGTPARAILEGAPSRFIFEVAIAHTLSFVATFNLSFRYAPSGAEDVKLLAEDTVQLARVPSASICDGSVQEGCRGAGPTTASAEVSTLKSFRVASELSFMDFHGALPKGSFVSFGSTLSFSFKLYDRLSEHIVYSLPLCSSSDHRKGCSDSKMPESNVVLLVAANTSQECRIAATPILDPVTKKYSVYNIEWVVDGNTPSGSQTLCIRVLGPDAALIPFAPDSLAFANLEVLIGGRISVDYKFRTVPSSVSVSADVFAVEFDLLSDGTFLKGVQLRASVEFRASGNEEFRAVEDPELSNFAVASHPSGAYQVSWTKRSSPIAGRSYRLRLNRVVDLALGYNASFVEFELDHTSGWHFSRWTSVAGALLVITLSAVLFRCCGLR